MGAEHTHNLIHRWDLHMKINEASVTRFISVKALSLSLSLFFLFIFLSGFKEMSRILVNKI